MPLSPDQALAAFRAAAPLLYAPGGFAGFETAAAVLHAANATLVASEAPDEVGDLVSASAAVVISLGAPSPTRAKLMESAAKHAHKLKRPWLLDPVGVDWSAYRLNLAEALLKHKPAAIRGNAKEIFALAGKPDAPLAEAAPKLAKRHKTLVIASGAGDFVTCGKHSLRIANGHPMMHRIPALGCALSALVTGFIAAAPKEAVPAAAAALAYYGLAGERAATRTEAPGSFAVAFTDALAELHPSALVRDARIADQ